MEVPSGSIYFWMYEMGLKHVDLDEVRVAVYRAGKQIRDKDYQNYWNGWYRSDLYLGQRSEDIWILRHQVRRSEPEFFTARWADYPFHPYLNQPEVENRWVPCNAANKPMIKWGEGCMQIGDACAYSSQRYLAENLKGTKRIVIDCDGNHDDPWDWETMAFLWHYSHMTHCINKPTWTKPEGKGHMPNIPPSFHLTFEVDRIIPTMHFPYAHIDIVGNRRNSLRYFKDKEWNGIQPAPMTPEIWEELKSYVKHRKEGATCR